MQADGIKLARQLEIQNKRGLELDQELKYTKDNVEQ